MMNPKQVLDVQVSKGITAAQSNEHLRDRSERAEKYAMTKGNYDPTRKHLNFEVVPGGKIRPVDTSRNIPERMADILRFRGIKDPNEGLPEPKYRTVVNIIFGGSRERMQELAFGSQKVDYEKDADNSHIQRKADIERWAKDVYSFVSGRYGEQNIAAFIVHLDEINPHVHCTLLPIKDGRFAYKEIFAGKDKFEYSARMKQLHSDFFSEVNTKWGMSRGTSISETGARHRSTEEYRRMLSEECTSIEENIKRHQQVLGELQTDIRLAERRVKGLTTMVANLEVQKAEKESLLSAAELDLKENKGNAAELASQIKMLEKELQGISRQLADKQEKLQTADRQLISLKENMDAIAERTETLKEEAYHYSQDVHSKVDTLLKDVLLEDMVSEYRSASVQMGESERQLLDGSLMQSIAERGTEVMHCATMLFLGMVDDATTFAESHGGGGGGSDLRWGRDEDEDNRAWALRCMRMASRMMRPAIGKKPKR
ncbi:MULTISPECIES: MobV family relaxase [Bacteroidales]|uniref:MobV family relaxase n=1 Tax=Bacteroidales TaxID=171549 RepID=UPI001D0E58B2|nr:MULTISPECIES: MobV family relaxase [Bacteroides]MCC2234630.1 plasmid recombination protein [Bacteroides hominis (ex Afrizal et al. 2022)]MCS3378546.1 plasmid recombination protein [Bacteroides xylanisolvens]